MDTVAKMMRKRQLEAAQPRIEGFLADIEVVCRRWNISIGHEDPHGGFILSPYEDRLMYWLRQAYVNDEVLNDK